MLVNFRTGCTGKAPLVAAILDSKMAAITRTQNRVFSHNFHSILPNEIMAKNVISGLVMAAILDSKIASTRGRFSGAPVLKLISTKKFTKMPNWCFYTKMPDFAPYRLDYHGFLVIRRSTKTLLSRKWGNCITVGDLCFLASMLFCSILTLWEFWPFRKPCRWFGKLMSGLQLGSVTGLSASIS